MDYSLQRKLAFIQMLDEAIAFWNEYEAQLDAISDMLDHHHNKKEGA